MEKVYIVSACRTPIGKFGGALSSLSATDLGEHVIREAMIRSSIPSDLVDHVSMGCVIQAGLGQNPARQASLKAGLPATTTAETVNMVCGSGLEAVNSAARRIQWGEADVVVAGGMESMSKAPFAIMNGRFGYRMGSPMVESSLVDTMVKDGLWDAMKDYHMGITAENLVEQYGLCREELDEFALRSQQKAMKAQLSGAFMDEIAPITVSEKKGSTIIETDEGPRPEVSLENLQKLKPAFKTDGIVSAGNSSGISDGAAAIVLASERIMEKLNLSPLAEWVGGAVGGIDPEIMGLGPVVSTKKLLTKLNLEMSEIDLIEANEAFAAQSILVQRELKIPSEKLNIHGGAIALGLSLIHI